MALLRFSRAFEGCSILQGAWHHLWGHRQGSAGKEPTGAAGANLLDAHQALPRWKEPPGPGTAGASSKHRLLYTKVWVKLVDTF